MLLTWSFIWTSCVPWFNGTKFDCSENVMGGWRPGSVSHEGKHVCKWKIFVGPKSHIGLHIQSINLNVTFCMRNMDLELIKLQFWSPTESIQNKPGRCLHSEQHITCICQLCFLYDMCWVRKSIILSQRTCLKKCIFYYSTPFNPSFLFKSFCFIWT
jgi:hypothetical protein